MKTTISPSGYNSITETADSNGLRVFTLEKPRVTVKIPATKDVYTPTSTAADIAAILDNKYPAHFKGFSALELGCGDHALLAHTLVALGAKHVLATDIDPKAVHLVQRYAGPNVEARRSDLFSNIKPSEKYDLILFNAPQMPMSRDELRSLRDWHDSPGTKGYEAILATLEQGPVHLNPDGIIIMMMFDFLLTDGKIKRMAAAQALAIRKIGTVIKPLRAGGQTEKSLPYISQVFPKLEVKTDNTRGRHITASVLEFS